MMKLALMALIGAASAAKPKAANMNGASVPPNPQKPRSPGARGATRAGNRGAPTSSRWRRQLVVSRTRAGLRTGGALDRAVP